MLVLGFGLHSCCRRFSCTCKTRTGKTNVATFNASQRALHKQAASPDFAGTSFEHSSFEGQEELDVILLHLVRLNAEILLKSSTVNRLDCRFGLDLLRW